MLQDLDHGRLENEFRNLTPEAGDIAVCFADKKVLLRRTGETFADLPRVGSLQTRDWQRWGDEDLRYVFRLHGRNYFIWMGVGGEGCTDCTYEGLWTLRQSVPRSLYYCIMTAWHLYNWYRLNRFCGGCGAHTVHDDKERMLRCPQCGNMIFPRINPAVIVAVTDGDRIVMTKYAGRGYTHYALIAGFTEIGETVEQTVQREVMEEVGLKVKNLRYYKSQPWGIDGNILMGFYCDLDGSDVITKDDSELAVAEWHHRHNLPSEDDGISLTREMIRVFGEGKEPK